MVTKRDFSKWKRHYDWTGGPKMWLTVDCLPNAVGKQPSIPLIYLGRKWTLNWWWWWWWWLSHGKVILIESCNWTDFISEAYARLCQTMPLKMRQNTALGCNHQSIYMSQLQSLCSAALVLMYYPKGMKALVRVKINGVWGLTPPGAVLHPLWKVPKWGWVGRFWAIYS